MGTHRPGTVHHLLCCNGHVPYTALPPNMLDGMRALSTSANSRGLRVCKPARRRVLKVLPERSQSAGLFFSQDCKAVRLLQRPHRGWPGMVSRPESSPLVRSRLVGTIVATTGPAGDTPRHSDPRAVLLQKQATAVKRGLLAGVLLVFLTLCVAEDAALSESASDLEGQRAHLDAVPGVGKIGVTAGRAAAM